MALLVDDGFSPLEFSVACEVFGFDRSDLRVPWYRLLVCGAHPGPISAAVPFNVVAPHGLEGLRAAGTIVVPPIDRDDPPISAAVLEELRRAHRRGARLMSLCTGAFVLAEAGILDGKTVTTHWRHSQRLAAEYPAVRVDRDVLYVDEGDVLTSAGSAASIDLCLHVVRCDFGAEIANRLARRCVVPPHRDGGQAQFVEEPFTAVATNDRFAGHAQLGPGAPRRAHGRRRSGPAGRHESPFLCPAVPGRDRHVSSSLADLAARAAGSATAGDDRSAYRSGGVALRSRHQRQPPLALLLTGARFSGGLPPDLPGEPGVGLGLQVRRRIACAA